jgi:cytochrome c
MTKHAILAIVMVLAGANAASAADVANGEKVFKKCQACHEVGAEAKNKVGPVLNNVFGRTAGTQADFATKYSKAMIDAGAGGLVWTEETVEEYIEKPKDFVAKNKMAFVGLKKEEERDDVIAYLLQFSPDYKPAN